MKIQGFRFYKNFYKENLKKKTSIILLVCRITVLDWLAGKQGELLFFIVKYFVEDTEGFSILLSIQIHNLMY